MALASMPQPRMAVAHGFEGATALRADWRQWMFMADEIWLIRHGETAWSLTGQHTGRTDLPLTEKGELEARSLPDRLADVQFQLVLCSPLQRARRTCEIAGFLPQAVIDPECQEWDYGDLNGITRHDYVRTHPGWNIWDGPVPHGETLEHVSARAAGVLARIAATPGRAAIFSHGHFLRILTATYLGLPPSSAKGFALETARVSVLGKDSDFPAILSWNL
jgi:probable phosphoglycerate mutase